MIYYLSLKSDTPKKDYWDYGLIYYLFEGLDYQEVSTLSERDTAIVVIPARSHAELVKEINAELNKLDKVVLFLMGDEEGEFPIEQLQHSNMVIWVQNPRPGRHEEYRKIGTGYPPHLIQDKPKEAPQKSLDFFFAGQITHERRRQMLKYLKDVKRGKIVTSEKFTEGIEPKEYYSYLANAKVAPCPSGPETPDTFRLFEALELGCVPIADNQTPVEDWSGFWEWLFDQPVPFPTITHWRDLPGYIEDTTKHYPHINNKVQSFWKRHKWKLKDNLYCDADIEKGNITVIIPVSPISSHPDTYILDETIESIKHHFPTSKIITTFDGVREEQENMLYNYREHIRRILWKYDVYPVIFDHHTHQVGMMRKIIDDIDTDLILYVEQDTPLVIDETIDWIKLKQKITSGESNLIRLHFEGRIPEEHEKMMLGEPEDDLLKTVQWSQRPHLASTAFYRRLLNTYFSSKAKCFFEDVLHGKLLDDFNRYGNNGWNQWRIHIYYPGENIKRSYHTDGRQGVEKFDVDQIF